MNDNMVSVEWFERGRKHRYGRANPERFDEPVWEWMEREKVFSWDSMQRFGIPWEPDPRAAEPNWWFSRLWVSFVDLGDGRCLSIGGMSDAYGDDALDYNDVREYREDEPSATSELLAIYGYPREVFPGVCGATATLIGEHVYVIGGVEEGPHWDAQRAGVYRLHVPTMRMEKVETSGEDPGAIRYHFSELSADGGAIVVSGGNRKMRAQHRIPRGWKQTDESRGVFELCLRTHRWRVVEERPECFEMKSESPRRNQLPLMSGAVYHVAGKRVCAGCRGRFRYAPHMMRSLGPREMCWADRGVELHWSGSYGDVRIFVWKRVDRRWLRSVARRTLVLRERAIELSLAMIRHAERNGESASALSDRLFEGHLQWLREQRRMMLQQKKEERSEA